jgi:hypothetical protein
MCRRGEGPYGHSRRDQGLLTGDRNRLTSAISPVGRHVTFGHMLEDIWPLVSHLGRMRWWRCRETRWSVPKGGGLSKPSALVLTSVGSRGAAFGADLDNACAS